MKLQVGVIGATGYIGTPYRREMREASGDFQIIALCARRERLEAAGREDAAICLTHDWREVVEHPDVNFVVVATPDALHHEAVLACAANGKHLLCEKPVGINAREAKEMWQAYQHSQLAHYVPFWTRYVEAFRRARDIVADGRLGDIQAVIYRWHNPRPAAMPHTWRDDAALSSAGSIADVGSHAYDAVRWILGEEAKRVLVHADVISPAKPDLGEIDLSEALDWGESHAQTQAATMRKGTAYDYAAIAWEWTNGAVGTLVLSHAPALRKGLSAELELHGSDASLGVDRLNGRVSLINRSGEIETIEAPPPSVLPNRFASFVYPAINGQLSGQAADHPRLFDGYRVQIFTDAAALSARRGTWVELAEIENS